MDNNLKKVSTLGLLFITLLAAIQYVFLRNVPDSVSTFSFICITNLLGFVIIGCAQFKKLFSLDKRVLLKGAIFAVELTLMNFFLLLGSRGTDSVIISSVMSMYFVFITPMLLLLRRRVNLLSGIASSLAVIALLLMFGADTGKLFSSVNVVYLLFADIFFAGYVVSISVLGGNEDSTKLTLSQMIFGIFFALIGWVIESALGHGSFSLPTQPKFWISAIYIGVCIRAIYGIVQISCQKHVPAINASLILSSEIIITLLLDPIMCRIFNEAYTPVNIYQVIGCVLFILATLLLDEEVMAKIGYIPPEESGKEYIDSKGKKQRFTTVSEKMIFNTLSFTMLAIILSTVICLTAINSIRNTTVESSTLLGKDASNISETALTQELENQMQQLVQDKAKLADEKLSAYSDACIYIASYAGSLLENPDSYPAKETGKNSGENSGIWAMQRGVASEDIPYEAVADENKLFGNLEDVFKPVINNVDNITTIYVGFEPGLMLSYDIYSFDAEGEEMYYNFREADWYKLGAATEKYGYSFTDTYLDAYGRGLTITCVSPIYAPDGSFYGTVAMDILVDDLNASMVNDGIIDPNAATLINSSGEIIADKKLTGSSEKSYNIFDPAVGSYLCDKGHEILSNGQGIIKSGSGDEEIYISYASMEATDWTLCIISPVYAVIEPAVQIRSNINDNTNTVVSSVVKGVLRVIQNCLVLTAAVLLAVTVFVGMASHKISDPLRKLTGDVDEISHGSLNLRTDVETNDEIGSLAKSFNLMTDSLQQYIADLTEVTAQEERIVGELNAATQIQASMLPSKFPAFPDRKEFEVYANMDPAKEVGGDFYDFFLVDEDHLALVIADVSGKGVPAALFMVIAKTLIKTVALTGLSPKYIFEQVNSQLCESNEAEMFVTAWMGILEISTGRMICANAGHEYPAIRHKNGAYELIKDKHGFVLAGMEGSCYKEYEIQLEKGDMLFVYTDGVPEATDAANELYGTDRMLEALNSEPGANSCQIIDVVTKNINEFVGSAPQFDDTTMLSLSYYGKE